MPQLPLAVQDSKRKADDERLLFGSLIEKENESTTHEIQLRFMFEMLESPKAKG